MILVERRLFAGFFLNGFGEGDDEEEDEGKGK